MGEDVVSMVVTSASVGMLAEFGENVLKIHYFTEAANAGAAVAQHHRFRPMLTDFHGTSSRLPLTLSLIRRKKITTCLVVDSQPSWHLVQIILVAQHFTISLSRVDLHSRDQSGCSRQC